MDQARYSTLLEAVAAVPDPRQARGKQLEWPFILSVIATTILSHQRAISAIAQWSQHHAATVVAAFQPTRGRVPSEATLRWALQHINVAQLEQLLTRRTTPQVCEPASRELPLQGYAIDGKFVRGAGSHGQRALLVSVVPHHHGHILAQTRVPPTPA